MKTKTVQTDMKASTAFKYETGGKLAWDFACCVESVRSDVTPSVTRAGAASGFIQNETHWKIEMCFKVAKVKVFEVDSLTDIMTIKHVGM